MSNLIGAENSHRVLPNVIGGDYSEDETIISDFREILLSTPQSLKLFQIWFSGRFSSTSICAKDTASERMPGDEYNLGLIFSTSPT